VATPVSDENLGGKASRRAAAGLEWDGLVELGLQAESCAVKIWAVPKLRRARD
jgi:hypothetical protein